MEEVIKCVEHLTLDEHKILIFTSYKTALELVKKELDERNITSYVIDGSVSSKKRQELVTKFNKDNTNVFLIMLKAGGTGLNLTGADMVIHYDPWWNQSAENQATDRAYRIGQKNNVQVYKLITSNSIEEKIYELQQKKADLIDNMLSTKTSFISKFSQEEIMKLFS
jgi:SNF2 family DNA or RNA helicase